MDRGKWILFQSVRLVGAVGIEQNALTFLRDYKRAAQLRKTYQTIHQIFIDGPKHQQTEQSGTNKSDYLSY